MNMVEERIEMLKNSTLEIGHILLGHECYNCVYCKDMKNTELEVDDFLCARDENNYSSLPSSPRVCGHWEEEKKEQHVSSGFDNYYKDKDGVEHKYIYCLLEPYENRNYGGMYLPGWYFADGTEGLNGPFSTFEETKELLSQWNG